MTDAVTAGLQVADSALDAVGAVAHALDKPDDVKRAEAAAIAEGRMLHWIGVATRAKKPARTDNARAKAARWRRKLLMIPGVGPVAPLPWAA